MSQQGEVTITPDTLNKRQKEVLKNIESYSKERKAIKFFHKLIFRPIKKQKKTTKNIVKKVSFSNAEGKIIRNISITTLDPFGFSVNDTAKKPKNWAERTGNNLHVKSRNGTIRNLLLFKNNQVLDSLLIQESERLVRRARFVRQVEISPIHLEGKDSVDLEIRVLDSWSLIPSGSLSTSKAVFDLTERNFIGLGHTIDNRYEKRLNDDRYAFSTRYFIPNIRNTYITATLNYKEDLRNNTLKYLNVERPFFSPLTKWAGGIYLDQRLQKDSLPDFFRDYEMQNFKSESQDYWLGHSFTIFKDKSVENRTLKFVTTARYYDILYKERPDITFDPTNFFNNEKLYLGSIGLTSRQFVQEKFLFNYGIEEDVPIGKVYSITGGYQRKNQINRSYFGMKYAFGNYYKIGYFGSEIEIGTFFNSGKTEQSALNLKLTYFSPIFQYGTWHIRQFIKPQIIIGTNRDYNIKDHLTLAGNTGIDGFRNIELGTQKALISFQTQTYAPGIWYGFRFSPFANFTFGMVGDSKNPMYKSPVYSQIGFGVLISNDYLVFSNFQISMAYYPNIPGDGTHIFKTNSFRNSDFEIPDYTISKPIIVPYQ